MDVAIIGAGAIGGYYGARLAHSGHRVHFLARSNYEHLRQHGLKVESVEGDFSLSAAEIHVYNDWAALPACELVCVTTKAGANATVFPQLGAILQPGTDIVLLQNGFGAEEQLAALYPQARIFAGLCFICTYRVAPGHVRHTAHGAISLAALHRSDDDRLPALAQVFRQAGLTAPVLSDVRTARFRKLVWNIPFNGLSVVLDATTDKLLAAPPARRLLTDLMTEIRQAAAASGIVIEAAFVDQMLAVTEPMGAYSPSMRLDYLAGRPLEIDAIYRQVIADARTHGFTMARTEQLADQLEYCQDRPRP
jgi:2-dehydropantoate 2-reductase